MNRRTLAVSMILFSLARAASAAPQQSDQTPQSNIPGLVAALRDIPFNDGWKFHKGDAPGAEAAAFDDAAWRSLDLPHDWGIEGPFSQEWASGQGFLPGGIGWYRKSFDLMPSARGKSVTIRFDGVYKHSQVWCNGKLVGGRPFGYMSYTLDLTPFVRPGEKNEIAVKVDHSDFADARWYTGSGIFRNVWLNVTNPVHVAPNGTFVTTEVQGAAPNFNTFVTILTTVRNDGASAKSVRLSTQILNPEGRNVRSDERGGGGGDGMAIGEAWQMVEVPAQSEKIVTNTLRVPVGRLWSVEKPQMYRVVSTISEGAQTLDAYQTPFGIRTFNFDAAKGFTLNGTSMKLKGVCLHEDAGALGAAIPVAVWHRRLALLKEAGCNAIRTSHNPPAPEFLNLCDLMGFLVMDEAFDEWSGGKNKWVAGRNRGQASKAGYNTDFKEWAERDVKDMVLRDRNHPSIIMWSIGNEIDYLNDPFPANSQELATIASMLVKAVKSVDTTRPVTAACAAVGTNLWVDQLDIAGYNYQEQRYAADHAANPKRVIYGSENSLTPAAWQSVEQNDFIAGQFLWTGIDYLGEANAWPNRGSGAGILDLAGFKKGRFYQRQALWTDKPMVYLESTARGLTCYSNCDTVALYRDGTLVGETPVPATKQITSADALTGTMKVVGKKGGVEVCSFELAPAGQATEFAVIPDVQEIKPGGIAQIEVQVTDAKRHRVPDAAHQINCTITGGKILGIENGDQNSHEDYKALAHKAYQGRIMVYVQAARTGGEVVLNFSADGLAPARLTLPTR